MLVTYQIKPLGLVGTNLATKNFFWNIRARKGPEGWGGVEKISEKPLFHPHGLLCAWYAKCYFAYLLYYLNHINWSYLSSLIDFSLSWVSESAKIKHVKITFISDTTIKCINFSTIVYFPIPNIMQWQNRIGEGE